MKGIFLSMRIVDAPLHAAWGPVSGRLVRRNADCPVGAERMRRSALTSTWTALWGCVVSRTPLKYGSCDACCRSPLWFGLSAARQDSSAAILQQTKRLFYAFGLAVMGVSIQFDFFPGSYPRMMSIDSDLPCVTSNCVPLAFRFWGYTTKKDISGWGKHPFI